MHAISLNIENKDYNKIVFSPCIFMFLYFIHILDGINGKASCSDYVYFGLWGLNVGPNSHLFDLAENKTIEK